MPDTFSFTRRDITRLGKALGCEPSGDSTFSRFEVGKGDRRLALEIYPSIRIGTRKGSLISVYTKYSHLQLHFCTGFVVSKLLGEVTFFGESGGRLAGLIIEKEGGCSLYANVDRSLLSGDFTKLGPEVMLSGIALSMTDSVLEETVPPKRGATKKNRKR